MKKVMLLILVLAVVLRAPAMAGRIQSTMITHFNQVYQVVSRHRVRRARAGPGMTRLRDPSHHRCPRHSVHRPRRPSGRTSSALSHEHRTTRSRWMHV